MCLKNLATGLALLLLAMPSNAADLVVTITKVAANGRMVAVQLCTEKEFLSRCALRQSAPGSADSLTFTFPNVTPGTYAMTAFQDMDGNGRLDTGTYGIPTEPVAISRDARGTMGPPSFVEAAFSIADQTTQQTMALY